MNAEYRFPIVSMLSGAVFLDAGNVWLLDADVNRPGERSTFQDSAKTWL